MAVRITRAAIFILNLFYPPAIAVPRLFFLFFTPPFPFSDDNPTPGKRFLQNPAWPLKQVNPVVYFS